MLNRVRLHLDVFSRSERFLLRGYHLTCLSAPTGFLHHLADAIHLLLELIIVVLHNLFHGFFVIVCIREDTRASKVKIFVREDRKIVPAVETSNNDSFKLLIDRFSNDLLISNYCHWTIPATSKKLTHLTKETCALCLPISWAAVHDLVHNHGRHIAFHSLNWLFLIDAQRIT